MKLIDDPKAFLEIIPRTIPDNIQFRVDLQNILVKDEGFRKTFLEMCRVCPEIFFDAVAFTFNPRNPVGYRNLPFILRNKQRTAIQVLKECIDTGHDAGINKSRDEGATEIVCKLFALYWLLEPESMFLVGSRKEEYVDRGTEISDGRVSGDHKCLFHKILYAIAHLPIWMVPRYKKTYMHFENLDNGAVIDGESTNENFGAGDRRTAILLDEFGRVDYNLAKDIRDTINDTTECAIYSSTHFYGAGHSFNKIIKNKTVRTIVLPWYEHPEKKAGLYKSPDINIIELVDIDYYRHRCPEVFDEIEPNTLIEYSSFEKRCLSLPDNIQNKLKDIRFVADGCETIPGDLRSPWHDAQELRRTARDLAMNIWMCPSGASDMYFDATVNDRIRNSHMKPPTAMGELKIEFDPKGLIRKSYIKYNQGKNRLRWWGELINNRPRQDHNYIIGSDISLGTGASNSVAIVMDVNTNEEVGSWVCPDTTPEIFADTVVALANWVGGSTKPYLIWENNGGHGINFGKRIVSHHRYNPVYTSAVEDTKYRTKGNKWGWNSNRERKDHLLDTLRVALKEGLKTTKSHKYIIIHDENTIDELDDYVFYESGEIGSTETADQSSGARTRHGDRVIALGLCLLGTKEQRVAAHKEKTKVRPGCMAWRMRQSKLEKEKENENSPWLF